MFFLIYSIAITVILAFVVYKYVDKVKEVESLRPNSTFDNSIPRRYYSMMADYLRTRKSRFSVASKIELISQWNGILTILPQSVKDTLDNVKRTIDLDNNSLTAAEHKKAMIESLELLFNSDIIDEDALASLCYHLYYIILM